MHIQECNIEKIVEEYLKFRDNQLLRELFPKIKDNWWSRKNFIAHVTASGFVFTSDLSRVVLIKHKALGKLLQPGGHLEEKDSSPLDAALREIEEETGIGRESLIYVPLNPEFPELPFHIDVHKIPENKKKNEPEHYHIDFRYLFVLKGESSFKPKLDEVKEIKLVSIQEALKEKHLKEPLELALEILSNIKEF